MNKQQAWDETWDRYAEMEQKVRMVVTALNLLGINTIASCEGHLDHGIAAAWVDIVVESNEELAEMNRKADELQDSAEELFGHMDNQHQARHLLSEYERVRDQIMYRNLQEVVDLEKLIDEFYVDRQVKFRTRIVVSVYGRGFGRIISQGGLYQEAFDKKEQEIRLKESQLEMENFGVWLKQKWFNE